MNLERMLSMCRKGQWDVDRDLDWTVAPRPMHRDEEIAIVQYFTDMSGIELLAGALFEEQRKRVDDPTLKKIFATFVVDEKRHSVVAQRLADFYDVHHYRDYTMNPALDAFFPHFINAIRHLSPEVANVYITAGELILDVALLRSLNDYVRDEMSGRAMDLVNRDESRHIAVDYHMTEHYASPAYQDWLREQPPQPLSQMLRAWWSFANVLFYGKPFFDGVFWGPMRRLDPESRRLREAVKRFQLLVTKPAVAKRPFPRFIVTLREIMFHPVLGPVLGGAVERLAGVPPDLMRDLYSKDEAQRALSMSFEDLAEEALGAKALN